MSGEEYTIQMLWRCSSCNAICRGRDMNCQRCGNPKQEDERYYMLDEIGREQAVTDGELLKMADAGANWRCRFCGSQARAYDGSCAHCGAGKPTGAARPPMPPR